MSLFELKRMNSSNAPVGHPYPAIRHRDEQGSCQADYGDGYSHRPRGLINPGVKGLEVDQTERQMQHTDDNAPDKQAEWQE